MWSQSLLYNINLPKFEETVNTHTISQLYVSISKYSLFSILLYINNTNAYIGSLTLTLLAT